ncbi:hypothetical protein E3E35_08000 [Thermococcus sp. GR7]|uniref:restriction endonuclease n=1 Tax=unclassified Thermococcus TaxID=2627626 RepID=UPI001430C846|nr:MULTISPECIES: restriction endonuclease [unclassified Thermococcus]NJE47341.1 hypothetical protein [Thermococcus sp. GR7]NJE79452.1 hypothetical protein [Thermococcus sp. GR4]NJF23169.1 hypothetical protein [Thermococcus sp. GR5]
MPRRRGKGSGFEKRVTSRYRKGGYRVKRNVVGKRNGRRYEIDAIIERGKERYPTEIKGGKQILTASQILAVYKKLSYRKGIPTLILGPNVKLTNPAKKIAKEKGLRIKRITR